MLNIFWKYWKDKNTMQIFLSAFLMCGMCIALVCGFVQTALATPSLYPGMGGGHRDDVAPMHYRMEEEKGRLLAPGDWGIGNQVRTTGTISVIALLVEFKDVKFAENRAYFKGLMDGFVQYYHNNSYGALTVNYTIATNTVTLNNSLSDYGLFDNNTLVEDAVKAADGNVGFSQYDALIVIHAGQGEESSRTVADIYSRFTYNSVGIVGADGVGVYGACIVPEHEGNSASPFGIFCHEFGHQLGLPDLYDITDRSEGIGEWGVMSSGAWNGSPQGSSPSHFDAWCKVQLDWVTPQTVTTALIHENIPQAETNPVAYKLWNNTMDSEEYFLVENRQDVHLPSRGLLIWHVDDGQQTNGDSSHYIVALEQADGARELERKVNRGNAGDPYPGSSIKRCFDNWSNPNSRSYSGTNTYIAVTNISNSAATMTADLSVVPSSINLISPLDNAVLPTKTPAFFWTAIEGVGTYTLIVGTCSFIATTTNYFLNTPLEENASYTWQVTANATNAGTSTIWQFWINAVQSTPSTPTALFPINGQTISQQTPTFRWQVSTDPDPMDEVKYILMHSLDFGTPTSSGTISSNSWTPSQNMGTGNYSWKVKAVDTTGNVTWSGTSTFAISLITENGGTVTVHDGTSVVFPKGAVSGVVNINILMLDEIGAAARQVIEAATNVNIASGTIRQIQVTSGQAIFDKPVTIHIPYSGTNTQVAYSLTPDSRWERLYSSTSTISGIPCICAQVYFPSVFGIGPAANYSPAASIISSVTNWPNPFVGGKESTTIYYVLRNAVDVSINIYNPIGELVWKTRFETSNNGARPGANEITWDGKNGEGERVSQGIYFCVIEADGSREIRKIGVR